MRAKPWEVPDGLWERIEPLLPKRERRRKPRSSDSFRGSLPASPIAGTEAFAIARARDSRTRSKVVKIPSLVVLIWLFAGTIALFSLLLGIARYKGRLTVTQSRVTVAVVGLTLGGLIVLVERVMSIR